MTLIFLNFLGDKVVKIRVFLAPNNVGNKGLDEKKIFCAKKLTNYDLNFQNFLGD